MQVCPMTKRLYKHKLLLDENLSRRRTFPHLNEYFDVKHLRDDLHFGGIDDTHVYDIAVSQNRIIITKNWTDFLNLAGTKKDAGIIGIPSEWQDKKVDIKLMAFLRKNTPASLCGKVKTLGASEAERLASYKRKSRKRLQLP
jgi:hypothetical protein